MKNVKVKFYLKRMVQFSAKVDVPVSLWDTKSGRAIGKSKTATSVNLSLDKVCVLKNVASQRPFVVLFRTFKPLSGNKCIER